jgi:RNA polymerase sigma-70 factor (ECF subfamily)
VNYSSLDDQALIELVAHADADALSELYDRYSRLIFGLAVATVGDRGTAEEITLDVFTRVWQKADLYRAERAKVSTWLTSITRHRAIDELRRRGARVEQYSVTWAEVPPGSVPSVNGPEHSAQRTLQRQRIQAAVAQLPEEQRQALALSYFKGYSHREIAKTLEQPLGTVKTRIRLAMQKLREMLQDEPVQIP